MYVRIRDGLGQISNRIVFCDTINIHLGRLVDDLKSMHDELKKEERNWERIERLKQSVIKRVDRIVKFLNELREHLKDICCVQDLETLEQIVENLPWLGSLAKQSALFGETTRKGQKTIRVKKFTYENVLRARTRLIFAIRKAREGVPDAPCCSCWAVAGRP